MRIKSILLLLIPLLISAQDKELRGVWFAWAGADIPSKAYIAEVMDDLAAHNVNTVYVDVWRYGYPYFRSEVFYNLTGLYTDPGLDEGRDVLQDFIAEGHRAGLEVEAWFEAGFAACHEGNDDVYDARPHWFAKKKNGGGIFESNGGIQYRWLSHCNDEAQQFLIDLCQEVAEKYDVDGIELDRVRYPDLDCGYDSATVALYKSEHDGSAPPTNIYDSQWIRWRADKLNLFMAEVYDSLKIINPDLTISNAPLWYGYDQFCQDYPNWINNGSLDIVVPQLYYASNSSYIYRLDRELPKVNDKNLFYPGISTTANGVTTPEEELIKMIRSTRNRNLPGHVIWYHKNLRSYLDTLQSTVYQNKADIPYRTEGWRLPAIVVHETDAGIQRSQDWNTYTTIPGYDGQCMYTLSDDGQWITYNADVPVRDWYAVYVYIINQAFAHQNARYVVSHKFGEDTVFVNQRLNGNARWYKLGDFYLEQGQAQTLLELSAESIDNQNILFTDAMMLIKSNRPLDPVSAIEDDANETELPLNFELYQPYPNPFNASVRIDFQIDRPADLSIDIFNILGEKIEQLTAGSFGAGKHHLRWDAGQAASGVYLITFKSENKVKTRKVVLIR